MTIGPQVPMATGVASVIGHDDRSAIRPSDLPPGRGHPPSPDRRRTLGPGAMLPSEKQVADTYDVGRDVVRRAVAVFRGEGAVSTARGQRTVVRGAPERRTVRLQR